MIYRILLTGGPHSGKTSTLRLLQAYLEKLRVPTVVVHESASWVVASLGSYARTMCQNNNQLFQVNVLLTQKSNELVLEQLAQAMHRSTTMTRPALAPVVMLFDRGVLDGSAFVDSQAHWDAILKATDTKIGHDFAGGVLRSTMRLEGLPPYDLVVHMQSCACAVDAPNMYSQTSPETATTRLQPREAAAMSDQFLLDLYRSHDNFVFIGFQRDFESKTNAIIERIQHLLHPFTSDVACSVCRGGAPLLDARAGNPL